MAVRTNASAVIAVLTPGGDYDTVAQPDLSPFIAAANVLLSKAVARSALPPFSSDPIVDTGTGSQAEIIERWLSAHFYLCSDQGYSNRSTSGASGSFQGQTQMDLDGTKYGQTAMMLDTSGALRALAKAQRAHAAYLGTPPNQMTPYASN